MTNRVATCERLKNYLKRFEGFVDTFQFLLSALAVTLVLLNEFVNHSWHVPYLGVSWEQGLIAIRAFTWGVFVFDFMLYGLASARPFRYARNHLLELIICITWVPYYDGALLTRIDNLLSLDVLTLIGSLVHTWMVGRWTVRRFRAHPHIVVAAVTLVTVITSAAVLQRVEPDNYKSLSDAIWFAVQTLFTVGYGDMVPKTELGRWISMFLIVAGAGIVSTLIALMSKIVSARLLPDQSDPVVKLSAQVEEQNKLIARLLEQNEQLIEQLKKGNNE